MDLPKFSSIVCRRPTPTTLFFFFFNYVQNLVFEREQEVAEETAALLLDRKLNRWQEQGELLLRVNGQLQFESRVVFGSLTDKPALRPLIQGQCYSRKVSFPLPPQVSVFYRPIRLANSYWPNMNPCSNIW